MKRTVSLLEVLLLEDSRPIMQVLSRILLSLALTRHRLSYTLLRHIVPLEPRSAGSPVDEVTGGTGGVEGTTVARLVVTIVQTVTVANAAPAGRLAVVVLCPGNNRLSDFVLELFLSGASTSVARVETFLCVVVPLKRGPGPGGGTRSVVVQDITPNTTSVDGATVTGLVVAILETGAAANAPLTSRITSLWLWVAVARGTGWVTTLTLVVPDGSVATGEVVGTPPIAVHEDGTTTTRLVESIRTIIAIVDTSRSSPRTRSPVAFPLIHLVGLRYG